MNRDSLEDFKRNYRHCYVHLKTNNEVIVAQFLESSDSEFTFGTRKYGQLLVDEKSARELIVVPFPKFGLYNIKDGAVLFQRLPNRQWKKAIHPDNCTMVSIDMSLREPSFNIKTVENILNPVYPDSFEEALTRFKDVKTVALNLDIGLVITKENPQLLWKRRIVGYIDPKLKQVVIEDQPMEQEIRDYVRKKDPKWLVITKY
jgi:hypothetical protein